MAFGLYKPGQGYWVRVLTAAMAGAIILAAAAWLWAELEKASSLIPKSSYIVNLSPPVEGTAQPGQTVALLGDAGADGAPAQIGTAVVKAANQQAGGMRVELHQFNFKGSGDPSLIRAVSAADGGASLRGRVNGNPLAVNYFQPLYLQAAGVALLLLVGAAVIYWLVGVREKTAEFLIATDGEMKKVNWSTRRDVIASTWVVIMWSVLLAAGLFLVDIMFSSFFKLIGVMQS
jgi:preprotein translocase SecE subunit